MLKIQCHIPEYKTLPQENNPYSYDKTPQISLEPIANPMNKMLSQHFLNKNILLRMIQSPHHNLPRDEVIELIEKTGTDHHNEADLTGYIHAAEYQPWSEESSTLKQFEAFHRYKPKCEESPQYPVDVIMVFDAGSYDQIEYIHPKHKVIAKDRYRIKAEQNPREALLAIITIN